MNIKLIMLVLLPGLTALLSFAAAQRANADVTLTVDNRGATAFYLSAATSPGVAPLETDNAGWTLTRGQRYHIINLGGASYHPFELRAGDEVLLSQLESSVGSLETDEAIAFESDDEGITFTLTPALAQALTSYNCAYHAAMTGSILTSL